MFDENWNTFKIRSVSDGSGIRTSGGLSNWVRGISLAKDGRYLLSAGPDTTARLWDISSKTPETLTTLIGHENGINCCAIAPPAAYQNLALLAGQNTFSPPSSTAQFLATGSRDKTIKLWGTNGNCFATLVGHDNWLSALAFHPGGRYLLSVADDKTLRCWDLSQNGKCNHKLEGIHDQFITCLRWEDDSIPNDASSVNEQGVTQTADGNKKSRIRCVIATGSMDNSVKIFSK